MRRQDKMPARNKKNFRSTKSGAGMTRAGVAAYRRMNLKLLKDVNHSVQEAQVK
jgi:hypothetical protein